MSPRILLFTVITHYLLPPCTSTMNEYGHGEITDDCHWSFTEFRVECPINHAKWWTDCVHKNIDIDTPRATRFLCGTSGDLILSWDITPWDTSSRIKDYYVVMGAHGDWCSDPMREWDNYYTPSQKQIFWWESRNRTVLPYCISAETDDDNRCVLRNEPMFVPYSYGPGCVLLYCDNMWDPCGLNLKITIEPKVWIEARNDSIRPFAKRIEINGSGWDKKCAQNTVTCTDSRGVQLPCYCHSVERGSMAIGLDQGLQPESAGPLSVTVETRGMAKIPNVVVGIVDFVDYTRYKAVFYAELSLLAIGAIIGLAVYTCLQFKKFQERRVDERAVFRAEHNPRQFYQKHDASSNQ